MANTNGRLLQLGRQARTFLHSEAPAQPQHDIYQDTVNQFRRPTTGKSSMNAYYICTDLVKNPYH